MSMINSLRVRHQYGTVRSTNNVHQSHPCIILALSEISLDSKSLWKPIHYLESPNPSCYIQLHMLVSHSYTAEGTQGSLTAVLITRKHCFFDKTHSERDPKWQTRSIVNNSTGKQLSLPPALMISQKAFSEMYFCTAHTEQQKLNLLIGVHFLILLQPCRRAKLKGMDM